MNENENLVAEEVAENTEQTVEQTAEQTAEEVAQKPKMYTDEEVNAIVGRRLARQETKIRRDYERQYGRITEALKAGTGKETLDEQADFVEKFYEGRGIKIQKPQYSAKDLETLARAEANEIISAGFEDVVDEVDRLAAIGPERMTARDKAVFKVLAEYRQNTERSRELTKIGVSENDLNSPEFKEFQGMFKEDTPISKVWEQYQKNKPRKEFKTMGSMKQPQDNGVKDYYTPEEIERLTMKDLDDPKVWEAVRRSMTKGG